jgi:Mce-associated membrane protein
VSDQPAGTTPVTPLTPEQRVDADTQAAPTADETEAARTGRRRPGGSRLWLGLVAAVVVSALVLALLWLVRPSSDDEVRDSALLAARTYTTSLTTFDARTLDEDVERVRRSSTAEFAAEYDETIAGLRETLDTQQTVSTGTVVGAGLESLEGSTASVLVAVNQQLSSGGAEPRTEANRLRMVLERRDGQWLIADVERL